MADEPLVLPRPARPYAATVWEGFRGQTPSPGVYRNLQPRLAAWPRSGHPLSCPTTLHSGGWSIRVAHL